jgi:CRP-like cAMP-binding protein
VVVAVTPWGWDGLTEQAATSRPHTKAIRQLRMDPPFSAVMGKRPVKLGVGDFFGELTLLDDSPRSATVEAQDEVLVARIGCTDFVRMLEKEPRVALVLLRTLAARLRSSEVSSSDLMRPRTGYVRGY